jgi:predicted esterase
VNIHHLPVTRTARYATLGELTPDTREVWLVLHGYAQLATDFIRAFDELNNGERFIIAPEGLNRFYAKGFGGKPAATWMTSEDREHEIQDYIGYLNTLVEHLQLDNHSARKVLLGFSQGVATASRWLHATSHVVDHFVICSGEMAHELQEHPSARLLALPKTYITGNNDPFIDAEKHQRYTQLMNNWAARVLVFEGGHQLHLPSLQQVNV